MSVLPKFRTTLFGMAQCGLRRLSTPKPTGLQLNEGSPMSLPSDDLVSPKVAALVDEIAHLSLLEVADLNRALKKRLNIADQPMMPAGMMMAAHSANAVSTEAEGDSSPDVPQKITYSVKLTKFDDSKKIALIKEIRSTIPGLNLVQAKKFVESAPVVVREDMGKTEAEEMKAALENAGATIEIV